MSTNDHQNDKYLYEDASHNGESINGGTNACEVLRRVELDSAYISEKLLNLDILLMQVENRENDYEGLCLGNNNISAESLEMAFEFDIISGILNSEVKELDSFVTFLQNEIVDARNGLSPHSHVEEFLTELEGKLHETEEYLNQSQAQVADIKLRLAKFERTVTFGTCTDAASENGDCIPASAKWKLQKVEHQRHILHLCEKSLAKELELEKWLADSRYNEDELKLKLMFAEREQYNMEESMEVIMERVFQAENISELLLRTSEELLGKLQNAQLNLNSSLHRECELRSELQECSKLSVKEYPSGKQKTSNAKLDSNPTLEADGKKLGDETTSEVLALREKLSPLEKQLTETDIQFQHAKASAEDSQEQQNLLHSERIEMKHAIKDLKENVLKTEMRAKNTEAECEVLNKTNRELTKELYLIKNEEKEKVNLLERKIKESDTQLEHAKATVQAFEEQQNMLNSTFIDMGNLIEDLKPKVSRAERRAESAESKCSLLAETNVKLNEELNFLRGRLEYLETSLQQADEAKIATAKDIGFRTKVITDLVLKLSLERERLQLQISMLTEKNRYLLGKYLKSSGKDFAVSSEKGSDTEKEHLKLSEEGSTEASTTEYQVENSAAVFADEAMQGKTVTIEETIEEESELEIVRSIGPKEMGCKLFFTMVMIVVFSVVAMYLVQ